MLIKKRSSLTILSTLISLSVLILSVPFLIASLPMTHAGTTRTISLVGTVAAWNASTILPNPSITVTQGDTLTVKLTSTDTTHLFFIDVDRNGIIPDCPPGPDPCSNSFTPTTPTTFGPFQISFAPGTYTYYCSLHPTMMLGSFIVQPAPAPAVGGVAVPTDKLGLLAPYLGLATAIALASLGAAIFLNRSRPRKNEK